MDEGILPYIRQLTVEKDKYTQTIFYYSHKIIEVHINIVSSNTTLQMSRYSIRMATTTMCECVNVGIFSSVPVSGILPGPGHGGADYFLIPNPWLNILLQSVTNLLHLNPLSNGVPCNSQIISIVKRLHTGHLLNHRRCPSKKHHRKCTK